MNYSAPPKLFQNNRAFYWKLLCQLHDLLVNLMRHYRLSYALSYGRKRRKFFNYKFWFLNFLLFYATLSLILNFYCGLLSRPRLLKRRSETEASSFYRFLDWILLGADHRQVCSSLEIYWAAVEGPRCREFRYFLSQDFHFYWDRNLRFDRSRWHLEQLCSWVIRLF